MLSAILDERLGREFVRGDFTMLVLSRRLGQRFQIGDDVRITIVKVDRNSVRIGIEAPADVMVRREEILAGEDDSEVTHIYKVDAA